MAEAIFPFHSPLSARWLIQKPDLFYPIALVQENVFIMGPIIIYLALSFQVMTRGLFRN